MFEEVSASLGPLIEKAFAEYCVKNEKDIHERIDTLIANRKASVGKGRKSVSTGGGASAVSVQPTVVEWKQGSYVSSTTRSRIEPILERGDSATTIDSLFQEAAAECRQCVRGIITQCKKANRKFFDSDFYFEQNNLIPPGAPDDCTVTIPPHATRLSELYPNAPLFSQGIACDDILQGQVGDCFLVGAVSALGATNPDAIKRLFVEYDTVCGVYGFVFFKDGGWEWVVIDDLIGVRKNRSHVDPVFASCGGDVELWPMLLEKAYAKVHFNWDIIDGGWAKEALVDLSGGIPYTLDLHGSDSSMTFKKFKSLIDDPLTVLGCAVGDHVASAEATGNAGEEGAAFGLFHGHQYSVTKAVECSDGTGFIQVRNPWGNDAEWTGPYSDKDIAWTKNPLHKKEVNPSFEADGMFWMKWEDFKNYMSAVDVLTMFPPEYQCLTTYGRGTEATTADNVYFFQVCDTPTDLAVALGQDDPKTKFSAPQDHPKQRNAYKTIRLDVYRLREIPKSVEDLGKSFAERLASVRARERNVFHKQIFETGVYCVVVQMAKPDTDSGCYLRLIGPNDADYAIWKFGQETKRLMIGKCPLLTVGGTTNTTAASAEPTPAVAQKKAADATLAKSVSIEAASPPQAKAKATEPDSEELRQYIKELENLIKKQQEEIARLKAASQPSPQRKKSSLERLGMSQDRWTAAIQQVFTEVSAGSSTIDRETAVNAFRLIVTLGAEMDDCFLSECTIRGEEQFSLSTFTSICNSVVNSWPPLNSA